MFQGVRRLMPAGFGCVIALAVIASSSAMAADKPKGALVIGGGAVREDNADVWQRIVSLAGGPHAKIAVIAAASATPEQSAQRTIDIFKRYGADAFFVPVAPRLKNSDAKKAAADPANAAMVKSAGGVFFTGGDQSRIVDTLITPTGGRTAVLDAVFEVFDRGGVISGSSAGAAIMSTTMFYEPGEVIDTLRTALKSGKDFAPGLGFIGPEFFVDQHLIVRGRFARMLPLMLAKSYKYGLGIDENTAIVVQPGKDSVEVVGRSGVILVDLTEAKIPTLADPTKAAFGVRNVKLSYLGAGDVFDTAKKTIAVNKARVDDSKLDWQSPTFKAEYSAPQFYADILGHAILTDAMFGLIDNKQTEALGLAMASPRSAQSELGFEFRFYKAADTLGYYSGKSGADDYSVLNMHLDVLPVTLAQPLYRYR